MITGELKSQVDKIWEAFWISLAQAEDLFNSLLQRAF